MIARPKLPDPFAKELERDEKWLCQERQPTPVDGEIEALDAQSLVVAVDDVHFAGAGKQPVCYDRRRAGGDVDAIALEKIGLVFVDAAIQPVAEVPPLC